MPRRRLSLCRLRSLPPNGNEHLGPRKLPSNNQLSPNLPRTKMHPPPTPHAPRSNQISSGLRLPRLALGTTQPCWYSTNTSTNILFSLNPNLNPPNKPPLHPPHRTPPPNLLVHPPKRLRFDRNRPSTPRLAPHNHEARLLPPWTARQNKSEPLAHLQGNLLRGPRLAVPKYSLQTRHHAGTFLISQEYRPRGTGQGERA